MTTNPRQRRPLLSYDQAAEYLGVTRRFLECLTYERRIPYRKLGDARRSPVRFDPDELDAWVDAHRVEAAS